MLGLSQLTTLLRHPNLHRLQRMKAEDSYGFSHLYDSLYIWPTEVLEALDRVFKPHSAPFLELGAGTGSLSIFLAEKGRSSVLVERSEAMAEQAKARLAKLPHAVASRLTLIQSDVRHLHMEQKFQCIFSLGGVFSFLLTRENTQQALSTVRSLLAPDGVFYFDIINPEHWQRFTKWKQGSWRYWYRTEELRPYHTWVRTLPGDGERRVKFETAIARSVFSRQALCRSEVNDFRISEWKELIEESGLSLDGCFASWPMYADGQIEEPTNQHNLVTFAVRPRL